jgi:hypothetical protein
MRHASNVFYLNPSIRPATLAEGILWAFERINFMAIESR